MKKINYFKKIIVCTLSSPINILAGLWSILLLIHLRASLLASKAHLKLEVQEKAKRIK